MNISQYSIKQATIEQIFNMFAHEQVVFSLNFISLLNFILFEENEVVEFAEAQVLHKKISVLEELEHEKEKFESENQNEKPNETNYNVMQIRGKN